ncbi:MAG: tetratricopeptide repeat protein [Kiritimatiellae bacterium]|nr:tetratricopeptide repeat protein [Kiritimatiellia bacterium]
MKRRYDDAYDDEEDERAASSQPREAAPIPELDKLDYLFALGLGVFSVALLALWSFPGLSPDVWDDAVVGAGLRPAAAIFPGFWRVLAHGLYSINGVGLGNLLLIWIGRMALGLTAGFAYLLFRSILSLTIRRRLSYARRRFVVVRGTAMLGAIAFLCAEPIWRVGQAFSPSGLLLLISVFSLYQFFSFLQHGQLRQVNLSMFLLGLLSADTPMGFVLTAVCWGVYFMALRYAAVSMGMALLNPIVEQRSKWHLTFLWAVGLIAGIAANCASFMWLRGLDASGLVGGDVPLLYATRWWTQFIHAASGLGWVLSLGICVLPLVVSAILLPRAVDEEQFLPYHLGAVFFVTGILALAQLAELSPLWFWTWSSDATVTPYFLQMLVLLSAMTLVFSLAVMGVDAACRDHERLATERFANINGDDDDGDGASAPRPVRVPGHASHGNVVLVVVPILILSAVVPGRWQRTTREMLRLLDDYVAEVLEECGPVGWIFTDGAFDSRLELAAAEKGKRLKTLSVMAGNGPYERYVRQEGVTDTEDRLALALGAPMTLRTWMKDKPERMKDAAIQLGFEVWKRNGLELPACSGVLARPIGMSDEDCAAGVERTKALADRILAFYVAGGLPKSVGKRVNELFLFVQWRIARLARMRAERADRAGQTEIAMKDVKLSDDLDHNNASLKRILDSMEEVRSRTLKAVTPREGLQLALVRADFALARRYAEPILEAIPDDPNANFAMGMSYYVQKQYARSEEYLKRCLIKNAKEPAVWNNLAMIMLHTQRYDEAEEHAKKALELIPESAEVKDTLKQIRDARTEAAKNAEKGKKDKAEKK